jgi:hypothetical protein
MWCCVAMADAWICAKFRASEGKAAGHAGMGLWLGFWGEVFICLVHEGKALVMVLSLLEVSGRSGIVDQRRDQPVQDLSLQFTESIQVIFKLILELFVIIFTCISEDTEEHSFGSPRSSPQNNIR